MQTPNTSPLIVIWSFDQCEIISPTWQSWRYLLFSKVTSSSSPMTTWAEDKKMKTFQILKEMSSVLQPPRLLACWGNSWLCSGFFKVGTSWFPTLSGTPNGGKAEAGVAAGMNWRVTREQSDGRAGEEEGEKQVSQAIEQPNPNFAIGPFLQKTSQACVVLPWDTITFCHELKGT